MLLPAEGAFLVTLSAAPSHVTVITALYAVLLAYLVVQLVSITQEQILVLIVSLVPILMLVIYAKPVLLAVPPVLQLFAPAAPCHSYLPSRQDHASATASPCSTTTPPLSPAIHAPASSRVAGLLDCGLRHYLFGVHSGQLPLRQHLHSLHLPLHCMHICRHLQLLLGHLFSHRQQLCLR